MTKLRLIAQHFARAFLVEVGFLVSPVYDPDNPDRTKLRYKLTHPHFGCQIIYLNNRAQEMEFPWNIMLAEGFRALGQP